MPMTHFFEIGISYLTTHIIAGNEYGCSTLFEFYLTGTHLIHGKGYIIRPHNIIITHCESETDIDCTHHDACRSRDNIASFFCH